MVFLKLLALALSVERLNTVTAEGSNNLDGCCCVLGSLVLVASNIGNLNHYVDLAVPRIGHDLFVWQNLYGKNMGSEGRTKTYLLARNFGRLSHQVLAK